MLLLPLWMHSGKLDFVSGYKLLKMSVKEVISKLSDVKFQQAVRYKQKKAAAEMLCPCSGVTRARL